MAEGDVDDMARLLGVAGAGELDVIRAAVGAYRPASSAGLERLIVAGRWEDL